MILQMVKEGKIAGRAVLMAGPPRCVLHGIGVLFFEMLTCYLGVSGLLMGL